LRASPMCADRLSRGPSRVTSACTMKPENANCEASHHVLRSAGQLARKVPGEVS
jgi:hypothetical protein